MSTYNIKMQTSIPVSTGFRRSSNNLSFRLRFRCFKFSITIGSSDSVPIAVVIESAYIVSLYYILYTYTIFSISSIIFFFLINSCKI